MNIPNLPTDNLYKFMALSGLLILILSISYPTYHTLELEKQRMMISGEIEILKSETDLLERIVFERTKRQYKLTDPEFLQVVQLKKVLAKIKAQGMQLDLLESQIKRYEWFCWVGFFIGLLLSVSGFSLWYIRVQRFQDKILKRQVTETKKVSSKNSKND
jgi:hypothetical protein